ncbi:hydantoinase/oxoprolinase family protein [Azospirillum endophyticum]
MPSESNTCRVGIDVGGTFTDLVLVRTATGELTHYKEPSVPSDPSAAVERGLIAVVKRAGLEPSDVELIVHGTTLGLNAIIQRKGARIALVVSKGFRDILEIGRSRMPNSYDLRAVKEEALVSRDLVFEIDARTDVAGSPMNEPTDGDLDELAGRLQASGVSAVAVTLLHSYLHPELERKVVSGLQARLPDMLVSGSAQVWPEIREYERSLVGVLNAFIHPLLDSYLKRLRDRLTVAGFAAPIYITASNGGTLSVETARERPIDTILSGPASGVIAANFVAREARRQRIITFDMGGTSSDISVSKSGEPEYTTRTHVGGMPLVLPVVNVSAIGAGGGSIVWVDPQGVLKVGPQSAGADPGPVCYRRGGTEPTVTDCYLVLGYFDPSRFLGGRMALDLEAAREALDRVGARLGMDGPHRAERAAEAALRVATAVMATELRKSLAQRGEDPKQFSLMPFGGAGPTHANLLAQEARLTSILVPLAPGTFCATGAILADIKRHYVRTLRLTLNDPGAFAKVVSSVETVGAEGMAWAAAEGDFGEASIAVSADMRYAGQAFELTIPFPDKPIRDTGHDEIARLFHAAHEGLHGFRDEESAIELTTLRILVVARIPGVDLKAKAAAGAGQAPRTRDVFIDGRPVQAPVIARGDLVDGTSVVGPAVIEQEDSTTVILPGWGGKADHIGTLHLQPVAEARRTAA